MTDRFRTLDEDRYDAVVIGSGTGGLVAAALLARNGRRVLVLDQHYVAGGNATTFRRPGYEFDIGVHYLGGCHPGGMLPRVLDAAGARVEFEEMDPDGFDTLVFPDLTFRVPKGIDVYRDRLVDAFPGERRGIDRYATLLRQLAGVMHAMSAPISLLWTLPRSLMLLRWAQRTYGAFLDTVTSDPRLRAVLAAQSGNYAQPPSRASLLVGAGIALHYLDGAWYPRGGGQAISNALVKSIEAHGGRVQLLARATRILVEGGRVTGVELESPHLGRRHVHAPVVISNADLKRTMSELVGAPALRPETISRVRRYEMSPGLGVVYLGIQGDLRAAHHPRTNYWIASDYDPEAGYAAVARGEFPARPGTYVSLTSVKDPENPHLAPRGVTNLQVMSVVPSTPAAWGVSDDDATSGAYRKQPAYLDRKAAWTDSVLASAERALPGLRGRIVFQETATPLTHARYTGATGGTSYGIALTPAQFLRGRPGPRTEIGGLFLCGASCRTGHGIAGVALSGVMAAAEVVGTRLIGAVLGGRGTTSHPRSVPTADRLAGVTS